MSEANLQQFISRVMADSTLQDQLKDVTDKRVFTETAVRLGRSNGFDFNAADVESFLATNAKNPMAKLSDQELKLVAGGRPAATSDGCGSAWTTLFGWCN